MRLINLTALLYSSLALRLYMGKSPDDKCQGFSTFVVEKTVRK
jgi:hypothetical protein